jgi:hypothetical protein
MTDAHPGSEEIAAWVTGGRPATDLAAHVRACADCELVAAGWSAVHGGLAMWSAGLPEPEPLSLPAPHRIDLRTRVRQAVAVVLAQVTVVRQQVWAATALVVGVGCLILIVSREPAGPLFALFAPMGAACGMALIYGRDVDPAYEISRASPVSIRTVLVARLLVVTAYDIAVAFLGTVVVASVQDAAGLWSLLLTWLGPLLLLSALSVLLSVLFRPWLGIAVSLLLWALRVATLSPAHATVLAVGVRWMWTTSPVVLVTALAVTALAVLAVGGREERTV